MIVMAGVLGVLSGVAVGLALKVAIAGPKAADRLTRKAVPDSLRQGSTGGLLTSLEGVDGRWTRTLLLVLVSVAFGLGAWLALQA
ncbi:hypothetical protein [Caulobacter sp. NIBR1757]|uniref:hypothetical protein n=1 Tax=Caulobacter sp. NIBR1757 TaxID=3016000 RepID=UPI0022F08EC8|nr:hypothetical protein [Caulobacter sp. NIBR1757]WGM37212.1 hypothetical protein AMEJIAPC_00106 [Caulobacter sp. NIBR1757]